LLPEDCHIEIKILDTNRVIYTDADLLENIDEKDITIA